MPALAHKLAWLKCPFHRDSPNQKLPRTLAARPSFVAARPSFRTSQRSAITRKNIKIPPSPADNDGRSWSRRSEISGLIGATAKSSQFAAMAQCHSSTLAQDRVQIKMCRRPSPNNRATLTQNLILPRSTLVPTHIAAEVHAVVGNRARLDGITDLLDSTGGNGKLPADLEAEVMVGSSPFGLPPSRRHGNERPQPFRNPKR